MLTDDDDDNLDQVELVEESAKGIGTLVSKIQGQVGKNVNHITQN